MSIDTNTFRIRFEDVSVAEAGIKAAQLRQDLLDISSDVQVDIEREDPSTQDFGTTLALVLGAPAAVAIAKGIADYLRRAHGKIQIETAQGIVIAEGISGDDAARIVEALSSGGKERE